MDGNREKNGPDQENLLFAFCSIPEKATNRLCVLSTRLAIVELLVRYLEDRSLWIYDRTTAQMIDRAGREYGISPGAEEAYRIQVLNTFCDSISPEALEEVTEIEENGVTINTQGLLESQRSASLNRSDDAQLGEALKQAMVEGNELFAVRYAALKRMRDISMTEGSPIGRSYTVNQASGVFYEVLTVPNARNGMRYSIPSTEECMERVLSGPERFYVSINKQAEKKTEPLFCQGKFATKRDAAAAAAFLSKELKLSDLQERHPYQSWKELCRRNPILRQFIKTYANTRLSE